MEKELNIAAILKDKPNAKLWSPMFGECEVRHINDDIDNSISVVSTYSLNSYEFIKDGRFSEKGEMCLFPSKEMRSWEKFAWKKGDVLCSKTGDSCIFVKWISADYTSFLGYYSTHKNYENEERQTAIWSKRANKEDIDQYILAIEAVKNGTLNLETLEIEQPKQKFKDGDIVHYPAGDITDEAIFIAKVEEKGVLHSYVYMSKDSMKPYTDSLFVVSGCLDSLRLATDSEKQQLFAALEKEGKVWNPDTLQIEDLPKKCEFKQMDLCLMSEGYDESLWNLCQFAFKDVEGFYYSIGGGIWRECIPYNDSTKHLLGTTDEWKGGEG